MKSIYKRLPSALRAVLPLFIIFLCMLALTSCFYVSTPEAPEQNGSKDFRNLIGDSRSDRPIKQYVTQRAQTLKILGRPDFISGDKHAIGYTLTTNQGQWIFPLCYGDPQFGQAPGYGRVYVLRMVFDQNDNLAQWKIVSAGSFFADYHDLEGSLVQQLNAEGPVMRRNMLPAEQE